ncbi:MAG: 3'-5' exonuclease [Candidatus Roizmanbacteria bacterium]|nr:3'-5' exonuclease [Candidatus Roizmanbacteria bacterium]
MFDKSLAIVDVETTGMSARHNRVIEIAIIRIEGNKIADTFTTCINPEIHIPSFITHLTGISQKDVDGAPIFGKVKHKVKKILKGATFVAHNAWFDYSFIQNEFERVSIPFESKRCCTVRLSRRLYPQYKSHSLASVIDRCGFGYENRHRAYDDAFVVWQLLKKIKKDIPAATIRETWRLLTV